jgi:hypothetical protein
VAEDDGGALVGLLVLDQDRVDQLYVEPTLTGRGIGSELIGLAKRARPQGLRLWTFESNLGAQRFYEKHGFRPIERTAGDNEEGAHDISLRLGGLVMRFWLSGRRSFNGHTLKAEGHPSAVLGVDGSQWPVAGRYLIRNG